MRKTTRIAAMALSCLGMLAATSLPAQAQSWPNKPVRLIVPYPAGGGADAIARLVGARLSEIWSQQVAVESRAGAGGNLASEHVARSAPDGYTLYLAGEFQATNLYLYPKITYDPVADFTPVSLVVQYPAALVVPNTSAAKTVAELIVLAKANAGKLTFASPGIGTGPHLAGELFKRVAGIQMIHVPYRGAAPAIVDLLPGRVDSFFNNIAPVIPYMQNGQLRILAVSTTKRTPAAPNVPTMAEAGLAGFDVSGWYAFYFAAKTPSDIVRKAHADTVMALADPKVRTRLEEMGLFVVGGSPDQLAGFLKSELAKWGPVIKEAGIKVE